MPGSLYQSDFLRKFDTLLHEFKSSDSTPRVRTGPQSIGVKSKVANQLPPQAIFQQKGRQVVERDRSQLECRHVAVRTDFDKVTNQLLTVSGIGYSKFNQDMEIIQGTAIDTCSTGAAQHSHKQNNLAWVMALLDKCL